MQHYTYAKQTGCREFPMLAATCQRFSAYSAIVGWITRIWRWMIREPHMVKKFDVTRRTTKLDSA
jgi:hypothetical protein